jgi:hypothetical protein
LPPQPPVAPFQVAGIGDDARVTPFSWLSLAATLGCLAAGVLLIRRGRRVTSGHQAFLRRAVHTTATVVDVVERAGANQPNVIRGSEDYLPIYHPVVDFRLPDGRQVTAETLWGARPAPARRGQTVKIAYDPSDPERVTLTSGMATGGCAGTLFVLLGVFFILFGLLWAGLWALLKLALDAPF